MAKARDPFQYEHITQPVAQLPLYLRRQLRSLAIGLVLIAVALFAGMLGYHIFVGLSWIDSYENAAMILSGMGPIATPENLRGQIFRRHLRAVFRHCRAGHRRRDRSAPGASVPASVACRLGASPDERGRAPAAGLF